MSFADLGWFAHRLLRGNGWGVVVSVEAHFDESGTDARELTVAGYLFEASKIDQFCSEWNVALAKYGVPYFHMVDCAHRAPPFDRLEKLDQQRLQMRLMRLIKRFSVNGIVCNVEAKSNSSGTPYVDAVELALARVVSWADQTEYQGSIAYFFEAGAKGQGLAEANFALIAQDAVRAAAHRYAGHAFVPKLGNPGVQAADLLAWQYHNFTKKRQKAIIARRDLRALLRHPHLMEDMCGDLPWRSECQSIAKSRNRIETVYYLPKCDRDALKGKAIIEMGPDVMAFESTVDAHKDVLACPNCFRALCFLPMSMIKGAAFKCVCDTYCYQPTVFAPLAFDPKSLP